LYRNRRICEPTPTGFLNIELSRGHAAGERLTDRTTVKGVGSSDLLDTGGDHMSTEPLLRRFDLEKNIILHDSVVFSTGLMGELSANLLHRPSRTPVVFANVKPDHFGPAESVAKHKLLHLPIRGATPMASD
jgi:hypothetical protein